MRAQKTHPHKGDSMNSKRIKIGIIAAMACEIDILKEALTSPTIEHIAGSDYYTGIIGGCDVVFVQCGIGKVSAAIGAQAMITRYQPDVIINTGCAGAMASDLKVGDIVLSDKTVEWDIDMLAIGLPRGYISNLDRVEMTADKTITDKIEMIIGNDATVVRGLVVSGDQFISTGEQRAIILGAFPETKCAEMEGAAIGHVCAQNQVPFCIIRCMSDNANGDSHISFAEFAETAGQKSANYLLRLLADFNN